MSIPNPRNANRRYYRRMSDERIWREFYAACMIVTGAKGHASFNDIPIDAADLADKAYTEYRNRFPVHTPELHDDDDSEAEAQPRRVS